MPGSLGLRTNPSAAAVGILGRNPAPALVLNGMLQPSPSRDDRARIDPVVGAGQGGCRASHESEGDACGIGEGSGGDPAPILARHPRPANLESSIPAPIAQLDRATPS